MLCHSKIYIYIPIIFDKIFEILNSGKVQVSNSITSLWWEKRATAAEDNLKSFIYKSNEDLYLFLMKDLKYGIPEWYKFYHISVVGEEGIAAEDNLKSL